MAEFVTNREPPAPIPPDVDEASRVVVGAAIEVHRQLGPGLLESIYERALAHELTLQGAVVQRQVEVGIPYKDIEIDGQRLDLLIEPGVVVEVKAVEKLLPIHEAQLMSYFKSSGFRVGLLINFGQRLLKDGIKRLVN